MVGQLSGSTGSTTASHNRFGSYFRSRTIPVNVNSPAQVVARDRFALISSTWRTMTDAERNAWNAAASGITLYDGLGVAYNPTGAQYYQSINNGVKLYSAAAALLTVPPTPAPPTALLTLTSTVKDDGTFSVAYTATPLGAGIKAVIEATRSFSPGRTFVGRSEFRFIQLTAAAAASPADIATNYQAIFGIPLLGEKVRIRAYTLAADGQKSAPIFDTQVVVA